VHQDVLHIAVSRSVTARRIGKSGYILSHYPNGNLVDIAPPLKVASERSDVAHAQDVVAAKLVLNAQAILVDLGQVLKQRLAIHGYRRQLSRDHICKTIDIVSGQGANDRRASIAPGSSHMRIARVVG